MVVRGISYLDAVAAEKGKGSGYKPINLEGRDAGIQRVLDHHGVSLSACLHTFDVMQARNGGGVRREEDWTAALLTLPFALRPSVLLDNPTFVSLESLVLVCSLYGAQRKNGQLALLRSTPSPPARGQHWWPPCTRTFIQRNGSV